MSAQSKKSISSSHYRYLNFLFIPKKALSILQTKMYATR